MEVGVRVWAQLCWSGCCFPFSLLPSLMLVLVYPRKALQGVNWPNSSFYVTLNGSQIQDHFSSPYGGEKLQSCYHIFLSEAWRALIPSGSSNVFFPLLPSSLIPGFFNFYYMEPLHNQAEEHLLPEVVALYIGANLKNLLRFPVIITLPCQRTLLIFMWQLFWFLAEMRALMWSLLWLMGIKEIIYVLCCSSDFITLEELNSGCLLVDVYIKICVEAVSWHVGLHQPLPHEKDWGPVGASPEKGYENNLEKKRLEHLSCE